MAEKQIKKFIRGVLTAGAQPLEDTFQNLIVNRRVDNAVGAQLDLLGKLVTQPRNGNDDETYRRHIKARIATNASDGIRRELINITKLVLGDDVEGAYIHVHNTGVAAIHIGIEDIVIDADLAAIIMSFLRDAASAGVRIILEYWPSPESEMFVMGSVDGGIAITGKGFGFTLDSSMGGTLAGSME